MSRFKTNLGAKRITRESTKRTAKPGIKYGIAGRMNVHKMGVVIKEPGLVSKMGELVRPVGIAHFDKNVTIDKINKIGLILNEDNSVVINHEKQVAINKIING